MKGGKVKMLGLKNAKSMQRMFEDIFSVSPQNTHIYIEKAIHLYDAHKRIIKHLRMFNQKMLQQDGPFLVIDSVDFEKMKEAKQLKKTVIDEIQVKVNSKGFDPTMVQLLLSKDGIAELKKAKIKNVDRTMIQLLTTQKDTVDKEKLRRLSDYLNGRLLGTFPSNMIKQCGDLAVIFKDIEDQQVQKNSDDLVNYYCKCARDNEGMMRLDTANLDQTIARLSLIDDDDKKRDAFACFHIYMQLLFRENDKLYAVLKIPEFEVSELKHVIREAIAEFQKTLPGCDTAFQKLLQSLDTFSNNFDNYYETFQINDRSPLVLIDGFINDIQKEYKDADNKECRKLLREFKLIQLEFAKRLGSKLDSNPVIKGLYEQLCTQIKTAEQYMASEPSDTPSQDTQ